VNELLVAFDGVTVRYGRTLAVDSVTIGVPRGCVYALLGRNGAGKSSLVRCLLGEQKPTRGEARLFGRPVWATRTTAMARIGVVPEETDIPPEMTAAGVAAFCAKLYGSWDANGVAERLDRFGVPKDVPVGRLSKGQKGQLALALALAPSPELLILDDPTLGLDAVARKELFEELVGELADRGTTVFLATHDLAGVERIADRVGVLVGGRLVIDEELEALKGRFRRVCLGADVEAARRELADFGLVGAARGGFAVEGVVSRFEEGAFSSSQTAARVADPEVSGMSLEEIFIALHGADDGRSS
jgi:ABC-2 type transport system ATP-binding protein